MPKKHGYLKNYLINIKINNKMTVNNIYTATFRNQNSFLFKIINIVGSRIYIGYGLHLNFNLWIDKSELKNIKPI